MRSDILTGYAEQFWAKDEEQRLQFRRMPMLAAACWFALGISLAKNWQPTVEAVELGVAVRHLHAGMRCPGAKLKIKVLAPEESYTNSGEPANNDSLVLRIEYGKASALLEGDAEAPTEQAMMTHGLTPVTLLRVGHHGSRTSTTPEFFAAVSPKDAVVSVGKGNTFGHPRFEVITRIAAGGTRLYRTDEFGLTTFLLDRDGTIREVLGEAN